MLETLKNAWKIPDLRKKILYTLGMLLLYRFLCFIPTPGVDTASIAASVKGIPLLNYMSVMTGSNLSQFTIMAMGITPYINASIIMQLLCVAIPALEELNKSGDEGRKKIAQITRYVTVGLGFVQAIALTVGMKGSATPGFFSYVTIGFCLAAGTALAMWIGERITEKGIGNGISLLIFAGIISNLSVAVANGIVNFVNNIIAGQILSVLGAIAILVISLVLIVGVVLVDMSERRIPIQYAKRMVGRRMYGGQSTHIPLRLNSSGVLPLIFASSIMQFPATILAFISQKGYAWWNSNVSPTGFWYNLIFAALILGFTFFYNSISFNPVDMSKNIQQNGGMIPGIRQGKPTTEFITKINRRITLFGAFFLAFLALLPSIMFAVAEVSLPFAASSLLIAVSVAVETMRQLESQMLMRHYKGFLK
ncbi:MAG: preprotein translocase subunit SecY [Clostridia bacterium]|nr:preprotein translocase subunit SecY [Clostridia bacterium]